ncbi:MAG: energy transducer TonB [Bacteroidota bacterium]
MYDNLRNRLDFDDLLFESRNKDYGAYQLRKRYNSVVIAGIILASLLVCVAVVFPYIITSHNDHVLRGRANYVQVQMENLEPPPEEIIVPPAPPPPEPAHLQEIVKYVPPVVVDTVLLAETTQPTNDQILSQSTSDQIEVTGSGNGDDLLSGQDGTETEEPLFFVEVMPSFKGGDLNKFRMWVQKRTNYPQIAIERKIQGKVFLTFIVETDGSVTNVTIVKGVDPVIDDEAVKAIQASPKWSPGLQRGQPVRVRYSMSLLFTI